MLRRKTNGREDEDRVKPDRKKVTNPREQGAIVTPCVCILKYPVNATAVVQIKKNHGITI